LVFAGTMFFYYRKLKEKALIVLSSLASFALLGLTAARVSFVATLFGVALSFLLLKKRILIILLILASIGAVAAIPQLRHRLVATITVNLMEGGGPKYTPAENEVNEFTPKAIQIGEATKSAQEATQSATASGQAKPQVPADIAPGEPVNYTELGVYRSFNIRFDVEWPRAIRAFYKNPLLGTGYSSITIATDNDYLRALGETGIIGFLSLALVFFILIKRYIKALIKLANFEKYFMVATLCTVGVMLSTAVFIDIFEASKIAVLFWIVLGVAWGIARNYEDSK
jgi:O-antigen ligase